ncbi:MAG: hypothetical protein ACREVG_09220 [Burkholderiales bacterium]
MYWSVLATSALALTLPIALPAWSATDAELAEIRKQIEELKAQYESRIRALEERLKDAESRPAAVTPVATGVQSSSTPSPSAFNPSISAILSGTFSHLKRDPADFAIAGFPRGGEIGPGKRGFNLGESELVFSTNVDPHFAGKLTLALTPENEVAVEEAYGQWMTAPFGLSPKFGRFLSGIGYLNEQHAHAWDFVDAPLAYQAFLGRQYANDGLQVRWLAPIEHFLELGGEVGNGANFPGNERSTNGAGSAAVFAHTGGDAGVSNSWRAGLSWLASRAQDRDGFTGKSRVGIADLVWKYAPNGNSRETNFKLQGEYVWRRERGDVDPAFDARATGWYLQGVYQFLPEWRVGARYERLDPGVIAFEPKRASVMLDYNPSEFSRIRLQFARSETVAGMSGNELFLQYILSLGAHGAHMY